MKPEKLIMRRGDPTTNSTTDSRNESNNGLDHRIARMAYELYERRGRMDGYALDDWLQAEALLNGKTK